MRAAILDRRVKKEARVLVREARLALTLKEGLRGQAGDLERVTSEVEHGLARPPLPAAARRAGRRADQGAAEIDDA
jgi:hypothetical protein